MFFGMSLQVATANTPGCASAFDVSMLTMRALWCGERKALAGEHALDRLVGHVLRPPGDVGDPVVAGEPSADGLHTAPAFETDSTASRILT